MIYALNTKDVSDHERRLIARSLPDIKTLSPLLAKKISHVCDVKKGETGRYFCIYCQAGVHSWNRGTTFSFHHDKDKGCSGSDKGLSGITNPIGVTATCT